MTYEKITWIDHIVDPESGQILQQGTRFTASRMNHLEQGVEDAQNLAANIETYLSDGIYQTAGGTATAITLTINAPLTNGYPITFIASLSNSGAATTINGKALYRPNTISAPIIVAGKAYTVWYSSPGDCFFIKTSEGGGCKFSNLVRFGNMTDATVWSNGASTSSIANNILTNTGTDSAYTPNISQKINKTTYAGQKIYIKAKIKVTNSECLKIELYTYDGANFVYASSVNNPMQGQEYVLSGICTQVTAVDNFYIFIKHIYADNAAANGKSIEISQAMACDLTDTYGAGNEPVKEEIDAIINKFGGWWDNDLSVLTADTSAAAGHILAPYSAYAKGQKIIGSIPRKDAESFSPSTVSRTISGGQYLNNPQTILPVTGTATADKVDSGYTFSSAAGVNQTGTSTKKRWKHEYNSSFLGDTFTAVGLGFTPSGIMILCDVTVNSNAYQITALYNAGIYQSVGTFARYIDATYAPEGDYGSYTTIRPIWSVSNGSFSFSVTGYTFRGVKYWAYE
ncbi:hypothetical protein LY28_02774 [Ruminiclostridium sufflavum DSM 19573]|uniref:Uncharacterized protein n=1 Tax=Ruminiclostridium sufflavum DSM 19573 TaxID=1121337 RepID=A0A318XJW5_9FIRM|nr:hypothetical protein [Ruminiclostridium sufflavum]PYG86748.1 hypothetical protein LY28_02774 [Ruminiclostridium sufflavum DSM 19573]